MSAVRDDEHLRKQVNASGFPFQLRVAHEVRESSDSHGWQVIAEEYHWSDHESGDSGFIDIVLEKSADWHYDRPKIRMAVECKRLKGEANWVFLITDPVNLMMHRARLLRTFRPVSGSPSPPLVEWTDGGANPRSSESAFCVIQGQTDRQKPMLERLCDTLLPSLECLAQDGLPPPGGQAGGEALVYVPVIVTNANLMVCVFHPDNVDLESGELKGEEIAFQDQSYVRFRKTLSTTLPGKLPRGLKGANEAKQRTVFVVHATKIIAFLKEFFPTEHAHDR